jgi:hypothetical protein
MFSSRAAINTGSPDLGRVVSLASVGGRFSSCAIRHEANRPFFASR